MNLLVALLLFSSRGPESTDFSVRLREAGLDRTEVIDFFRKLQTGVVRRDRDGICAMVSYPLVAGGKRVGDAAACRRNYEVFFTEKVVAAVRSQKLEALFANWRGVMIGRGEIWFAGICPDSECKTHSLKIIAINPA